MNSRRQIVFALGASALAIPLKLLAQGAKPLRRIGLLLSGSPATAPWIDAFRGALKELGWVEGRDIVIEIRYANGNVKLLDTLAAELVSLKPDLILAPATNAVQAAQRATRDIPIVFALPPDPIGSGLIASFARPGGHTTGMSSNATELGPKRLQLFKECIPALARVTVLHDPASRYSSEALEIVLVAGRQLGITMTALAASSEPEIEAAFGRLARERPDGLFLMEGPLFLRHRQIIVDRAAAARIPGIYAVPEYADAGGLMVFGVNYFNNFRRAAIYVDKILKGAKPADLPVEQPSEFELVINLKAAKALGLKIPQSVLLRATRVIE